MLRGRVSAASRERSTKTHRAAPRLRASRPMAPVPAKASRTEAPSQWARRRPKSDSLTRSGMGRVTESSRGARSLRERNSPPMMRMGRAKARGKGGVKKKDPLAGAGLAGLGGAPGGSGGRAAGRELLQEAGEVGDVVDGGNGGAVAVGVGVVGRELLQEAGEVGDVEERNLGAVVAVAVAGGDPGALEGEDPVLDRAGVARAAILSDELPLAGAVLA